MPAISKPPSFARTSTGREESGRFTSIAFRMMAILSITLAILNFLPIPVLDGGHLFFFLIEMVKGSPVHARVRQVAQHELGGQGQAVGDCLAMDEADQLCDRLAIIDGGKIKTLGSPAELKVGLGGDIVSLTLKDRSKIPTLVSALTGQPAIRAVKAMPTGLDIRVESPEKALPAILESANRLDCQLEFIEYHRPRLDDVFIAHTGRSIKDDVPLAKEAV